MILDIKECNGQEIDKEDINGIRSILWEYGFIVNEVNKNEIDN